MKYIQSTVEHLKILGNPRRLTILNFIQNKKTVTVSEISEALEIALTSVSQHLRILRSAKLVTFTRRGSYVSYRLPLKKDPLLKAVLEEL